MNQFDITRPASKKNIPYLLILQADALDLLETRIVAPIRSENDFKNKSISKIHINITIDGNPYIAFISELAAIPVSFIGEAVGNARHLRTEIISAIDLLFTGF